MGTEQVKAVVKVARAMAEAIKELGEVPSGHLYARVMGVVTLDLYNQIIDILKDAGQVKEEPSHLLVWIGDDEQIH